MAFDFGSIAGNRVEWQGSISPVTQVTDLSAHVDGGPSSQPGTNADADWDDMLTVYSGVGLMLALVLIVVAFHFFMRKHIY